MRFEKLGALHIHIPKTGGTTITKALADGTFPMFSRNNPRRSLVMSLVNDPEFIVTKRRIDRVHTTAEEYKEILGDEEYNRLYKFAIIRNPFQQIRSLFTQLTYMDIRINDRFKPYKTMSFEEFVMGEGEWSMEGNEHLIDQRSYVVNIDGDVIVDDVFLFEAYEDATRTISEKVGVSIDLSKKHRRTDHNDSYTPEMISKIMEEYGGIWDFYQGVKRWDSNVLS